MGPRAGTFKKLMASSVEFPLGRGHCTLGLVLNRKKKLNPTGKFFFSEFVYFC